MKKYSESRRERRERRAEENTNATADKSTRQPKAGDSEKSKNAPYNDEKKPVEYQSQNSVDDTKSNSSGENSLSQKERSVQNIRNKFRPTLQIYQPGRRRSETSATIEIKDKTGDKEKETTSTADGNEQQQSPPANVDANKTKTDKKVSRYTERRSKAREKRSIDDANDAKNAIDDTTSNATGEATEVPTTDAAVSIDNNES